MKNFRKTEEGFLICEECGKTFELNSSLMCHVARSHSGKLEYYTKWIVENNEGFCKECGKETIFHGTKPVPFCSNSCSSKYNLRKNGSPFSDPLVREKSKQTTLKNWGVECILKSSIIREKIKQTCVEKYGYETPSKSPIVKETAIKNCKEKHGVENVYQLESTKKKIKQTTLKNWGVENISQLEKVKKVKNEKCCKEIFKIKHFKDTDIKDIFYRWASFYI